MKNIFISYVAEDSSVAIQIAEGLEKVGYSTWIYERDSVIGPSYLLQTKTAIESAKMFVLLLSKNSVNNPKQITPEVVRAHESGLYFLPVLHGITWEEFKEKQPVWQQAAGAQVGVIWNPKEKEQLISKMAAGLAYLGIPPDLSGIPPEPPADRKRSSSPDETPPLRRGSPAEKPPQPILPPLPADASPASDKVSVLHISRDGNSFRFRIEIPDSDEHGWGPGTSEYVSMPISKAEQTNLLKMLEQATLNLGGPYTLEKLGRLMYTMLLPNEIQIFLRNLKTALVLSTNVPEMPWELFFDPESRTFLGVRCPVGRRLVTQSTVKQVGQFKAEENPSFLLIGNPRNDLKGSEAEVNELADLISSHGIDTQVMTGERATATRLSVDLQSGDFIGIHYAGHASLERATHQYSLLLADRTNLPASRIPGLLNGSPFIFLNACDTDGSRSSDRAISNEWKITEGLVEAFIKGGARCVVGTRWKVQDDISREFATLFYQHALNGISIGEALRQARIAIRRNHAGDTNWAAFVLYGDPTLHLVQPAALPPTPAEKEQPLPPVDEQKPQPPAEIIPLPAPAELFVDGERLNLERFTPDLKTALGQVGQEAQLIGHNLIGVPHIFNALTMIKDGSTVKLLEHFGQDPQTLRRALRDTIRSGEMAPEIPPLVRPNFSERGLACLVAADSLARESGAPVIEEAHLLLSILSLNEGSTTIVLTELFGLNLAEMRAKLTGADVEPLEPLNLAEDARRILEKALIEAYNGGYPSIETPHFMIALFEQDDGRFAAALAGMELNPKDIIEMLRQIMPPIDSKFLGPRVITREIMSQRMQEVVSLAEIEAQSSERTQVTINDLMVGLSRIGGSTTLMILQLLGVDFERLLEAARQNPPGSGQPSRPNQAGSASTGPIAAQGLPTLSFSGELLQALNIAVKEASAKGYPQVENPFLVIGLASIPGSLVAQGFRLQGIDPQTVIDELRLGMGALGALPTPPEMTAASFNLNLFSAKVAGELQAACAEAASARLPAATEKEVMLMVLRSPNSQTVKFLRYMGVNLAQFSEFLQASSRH